MSYVLLSEEGKKGLDAPNRCSHTPEYYAAVKKLCDAARFRELTCRSVNHARLQTASQDPPAHSENKQGSFSTLRPPRAKYKDATQKQLWRGREHALVSLYPSTPLTFVPTRMCRDFPGGPVVNNPPPSAGDAVGSLVGELTREKPACRKVRHLRPNAAKRKKKRMYICDNFVKS